jgi:hypothetical protein
MNTKTCHVYNFTVIMVDISSVICYDMINRRYTVCLKKNTPIAYT